MGCNQFEVAKEFSLLGGEILAIDEIHKYKNFEIELKQMHDMLDIKIIFLGSSAINIEHSKADLSRRTVLYRVNGLSYREFLEIKLDTTFLSYTLEDILKNHLEIVNRDFKSFKPLEFWREYLEYGFYPFYFQNQEIGTIRETFFVASKGNFIINDRYTAEIGGKNKKYKQIKDIENSFIIADDIESGFGNKIPLWLFGFLY